MQHSSSSSFTSVRKYLVLTIVQIFFHLQHGHHFLSSVLASPPLEETCFAPGQTLTNQFVDFTQPNMYCLRDLEPNSKYEVHISYRHVEPTIFTLRFVEEEDVEEEKEKTDDPRGGEEKRQGRRSIIGVTGSGGPPGDHLHADQENDGSVGGKRNLALQDDTSPVTTTASPTTTTTSTHDNDNDMEKLVFNTNDFGEIQRDGDNGDSSGKKSVINMNRVWLQLAARERGFQSPLPKQPQRRGTWYNLRFDKYTGIWGIFFLPSHALPLLYLVPLAAFLTGIVGRWILYSPSSPFVQTIGTNKVSGGEVGGTKRKN